MKTLKNLLALVLGLGVCAASFAVEYQEVAAGNKPQPPANVCFGDYDYLTTDLETFWDPSPSADVWGYVCYYSTDDGQTWKDAGYARADADGRIAKGLGKRATYLYKVAAFNESGNSAFVSASWNYGEAIKPGAISFGAYDADNQTLEYSWGASSCIDLDCYPCEYSVDGGKTWKSAGNVKWNRNYRTATKVTPGAQFRVCAKDVEGVCSPWVTATFNCAE